MTAQAERTLIDDLLAEQRDLTAVEQFARAHDPGGAAPSYRQLLPLSAPRPGEQYAFEVDLDRCSGCKACVTACHSLNGLDEGESWREVGALFGETLVPDARGGNRVEAIQQIVTTACHHCVEPGCLEGCPVLAYDKDPVTGIVRHLDDQCIGCSYCILKCPYDVPKYSAQRGIVRKCDLCHGRLSVGEAPACVQACPSEAIRITLVSKEAVIREFRAPASAGSTPSPPAEGGEGWGEEGLQTDHSPLSPALSPLVPRGEREKSGAASGGAIRSATHHSSPVTVQWLPDAPSPAYTLPTTRYVTKKGAPGLRSADHERPRPQPAHWPLILMLVMTQAGIGGVAAAAFSPNTAAGKGVVSLAWFFAGLVASVFHLGRPGKAWRIWMGWRTSWLSREAIVLNLFAGTAAIAVVVPGMPWVWSVLAVALGGAALMAQAMVYADTRREFWKFTRAGPRFFGTSLVLGLGFALLSNPAAGVAAALMLATGVKLGFELAVLKHADENGDIWTQLRRTAVLQQGRLRPVLAVRLCFGLCGGVLLPFLLMTGLAPRVCAEAAFVLCVLGEFAERHLFFTSVAPDRMP